MKLLRFFPSMYSVNFIWGCQCMFMYIYVCCSPVHLQSSLCLLCLASSALSWLFVLRVNASSTLWKLSSCFLRFGFPLPSFIFTSIFFFPFYLLKIILQFIYFFLNSTWTTGFQCSISEHLLFVLLRPLGPCQASLPPAVPFPLMSGTSYYSLLVTFP